MLATLASRGGTLVLLALVAPAAAHAQSADPLADGHTTRDGTGARTEEAARRLEDLLERGGFDAETEAEMTLRLVGLTLDLARADELAGIDASDRHAHAVALLQPLVANYVRGPRADEGAFLLGVELFVVGRESEGVEALTRFVRTYPDSAHADEAYVRLGDWAFDSGAPERALMAYKHVRSTSELYDYARYKLAWCLYNVGEIPSGVATLIAVVDDRGRGGRLSMADEAARDLVQFYADGDMVEEAYAYYRPRPEYADAFSAIGDRLAVNGQGGSAATAYEHLLADLPDDPRAFRWQIATLKARTLSSSPEDQLAALDALLRQYAADGAWARANATDPTVLHDAHEAVESTARRAAIEWDTHARKLGTGAEARRYADVASEGYDRYLRYFGDDPHAADIQYDRAEVLYKRKRYAEAYDAYVAVVTADPQGPHAAFSAESAVFAAQALIDAEPRAADALSPDTERPLTDAERKLVAAVDLYAPYQGKKLVPMSFRAATVLYDAGHAAEAAERFSAVIAAAPSSPEAVGSARAVLDVLARKEDWASLERWATTYAGTAGLGDAVFHAEVRELIEKAAFKQAEVTSDPSAAGDAFVAFATRFPTSTLAAQALHNASVHFRAAGRLGDEIAVRRTLVDDPRFGPRTKYYADQLAALGANLEDIAGFAEAADRYEALSAYAPDHPDASAAAARARYLRDALADRTVAPRLGTADEQRAWDALVDAHARYDALVIGWPAGTPAKKQDAALLASLTAKKDALAALERDVAALLAANSPYGIAAVVRLGESYEGLSAAFLASPTPGYLTPDQERLYRERLVDLAHLQDARAADAYAVALGKAHELVQYDASTRFAARRLSALDPERLAPLDESLPPYARTAPPRDSLSHALTDDPVASPPRHPRRLFGRRR